MSRFTLTEIDDALVSAGFERPVWSDFSVADANTATVNGVFVRVLWSRYGDRIDATLGTRGNFVRNPADLPALIRELLDNRAQQIAAQEQ